MNKTYKVIAQVVKRDGEIVPAFLAGTMFKGRKVSTEIGRRCRDLKYKNILSQIQQYPFSIFEPTKKGEKELAKLLK